MSQQKESVKSSRRPKISQSLNLKPLNWTEKQKALLALINDTNTRVVFIKGPAGAAKTSTSVFAALDLLQHKKVSDLVFIRPAVESADSKLGYLPGDLNEKFGVYLTPFHEKLELFLSAPDIKKLQEEKRITPCPINFARGIEWNGKCIVADEAQNMTVKEIITMITRVGENSKLLVCADPDQSDLPYHKSGGFEKIWDVLNDEEAQSQGIYCVEFDEEHILRSELVKFLVRRLKKVSLN